MVQWFHNLHPPPKKTNPHPSEPIPQNGHGDVVYLLYCYICYTNILKRKQKQMLFLYAEIHNYISFNIWLNRRTDYNTSFHIDVVGVDQSRDETSCQKVGPGPAASSNDWGDLLMEPRSRNIWPSDGAQVKRWWWPEMEPGHGAMLPHCKALQL